MEATRGEPRPPTPRPGGRLERLSVATTRGADALLDLAVLAFAAWTVVYHVCLVLRVGAVWAVAATAVLLAPAAWLALRREDDDEPPPSPAAAPWWPQPRATLALALHAALAAGAAALFAFTEVSWRYVWPLLLVGAAATLALTTLRLTGRLELDAADAEDGGNAAEAPGRTWPATLLALAWAGGLAVLSLFLQRDNADDVFYGRLSAWVAAEGTFPLRDVLFSAERFRAIIYPPLSSFEALVGAAGLVTGISVPDLLYFAATPVASAFAALAAWRLLRTWGTPLVGLALTAALAFLLLDAGGRHTLGSLFVGRIWQGKIVFLAVLVPLLFALLHEYARRPTRRRLVLVGAAGAAGVGLTSTAAFLVPVAAGAFFVALLLRSRRTAALGAAAAAAYPLAALAATAALGSRRAAEDSAQEVVASSLVRFVLGDGVFAFLAVGAILVGPVLVRRAAGGQIAAATALLVVCLFAPPVPRLALDLTGIARVLWRLNWMIPIGVLVGVVVAGLAARARPRALAAVPLAAFAAVLAVWGTPVWSAYGVDDRPAWKRAPGTVPAAREILAAARPGDLVLAPRKVSEAIVIMSTEVTTVAPRVFYALALEGQRGAHAPERELLQSFAERGLGAPRLRLDGRTSAAGVTRALGRLGVDVACVAADLEGARALLEDAGYHPLFADEQVACSRADGRRR